MSNVINCTVIVNNVLKNEISDISLHINQGLNKLSEILLRFPQSLKRFTEEHLNGLRDSTTIFRDDETNIGTRLIIQPTYKQLRDIFSGMTEDNSVKEHYVVYIGSHGYGYFSDWFLSDGVISPNSLLTILSQQQSPTDQSSADTQHRINILSAGNPIYWNKVLSKLKQRDSAESVVRVFSFTSDPIKSDVTDSMEVRTFTNILCERFMSKIKTDDLSNVDDNRTVSFELIDKNGSLYVFDEGCGQSSLLALNGFNLLIDAGYRHSPASWSVLKTLERIDTCLITNWNETNLFGIRNLLESKSKQGQVLPCLNYCVVPLGPNTIKPFTEVKLKSSLEINLEIEAIKICRELQVLEVPIAQMCRDDKTMKCPHQLYFKLGHGCLEAFPLWPSSVESSKESKKYVDEWNSGDKGQSAHFDEMVRDNSTAYLLLWRGSKINDPALSTDNMMRILLSSSCHENSLIRSLEEFSKLHSYCNVKSTKVIEKKIEDKKTKPATKVTGTVELKENKIDAQALKQKKIPIDSKKQPLITENTKLNGASKKEPAAKAKDNRTLASDKSALSKEPSKFEKKDVVKLDKKEAVPLNTTKVKEMAKVEKKTTSTDKPLKAKEIVKADKKAPVAEKPLPTKRTEKEEVKPTKVLPSKIKTEIVSKPKPTKTDNVDASKPSKIFSAKSTEQPEQKKTTKRPAMDANTKKTLIDPSTSKKPMVTKSEGDKVPSKTAPLSKVTKKPLLSANTDKKSAPPISTPAAVTVNKLDLESDLEKVDVACQQPSISLNTDDTLNNIDTSELLGKMEIGPVTNQGTDTRLAVASDVPDLHSTPLSDLVTDSPGHPKTEEDVEPLKTDGVSIDQDLLNEDLSEDEKIDNIKEDVVEHYHKDEDVGEYLEHEVKESDRYDDLKQYGIYDDEPQEEIEDVDQHQNDSGVLSLHDISDIDKEEHHEIDVASDDGNEDINEKYEDELIQPEISHAIEASESIQGHNDVQSIDHVLVEKDVDVVMGKDDGAEMAINDDLVEDYIGENLHEKMQDDNVQCIENEVDVVQVEYGVDLRSPINEFGNVDENVACHENMGVSDVYDINKHGRNVSGKDSEDDIFDIQETDKRKSDDKPLCLGDNDKDQEMHFESYNYATENPFNNNKDNIKDDVDSPIDDDEILGIKDGDISRFDCYNIRPDHIQEKMHNEIGIDGIFEGDIDKRDDLPKIHPQEPLESELYHLEDDKGHISNQYMDIMCHQGVGSHGDSGDNSDKDEDDGVDHIVDCHDEKTDNYPMSRENEALECLGDKVDMEGQDQDIGYYKDVGVHKDMFDCRDFKHGDEVVIGSKVIFNKCLDADTNDDIDDAKQERGSHEHIGDHSEVLEIAPCGYDREIEQDEEDLSDNEDLLNKEVEIDKEKKYVGYDEHIVSHKDVLEEHPHDYDEDLEQDEVDIIDNDDILNKDSYYEIDEEKKHVGYGEHIDSHKDVLEGHPHDYDSDIEQEEAEIIEDEGVLNKDDYYDNNDRVEDEEVLEENSSDDDKYIEEKRDVSDNEAIPNKDCDQEDHYVLDDEKKHIVYDEHIGSHNVLDEFFPGNNKNEEEEDMLNEDNDIGDNDEMNYSKQTMGYLDQKNVLEGGAHYDDRDFESGHKEMDDEDIHDYTKVKDSPGVRYAEDDYIGGDESSGNNNGGSVESDKEYDDDNAENEDNDSIVRHLDDSDTEDITESQDTEVIRYKGPDDHADSFDVPHHSSNVTEDKPLVIGPSKTPLADRDSAAAKDHSPDYSGQNCQYFDDSFSGGKHDNIDDHKPDIIPFDVGLGNFTSDTYDERAGRHDSHPIYYSPDLNSASPADSDLSVDLVKDHSIPDDPIDNAEPGTIKSMTPLDEMSEECNSLDHSEPRMESDAPYHSEDEAPGYPESEHDDNLSSLITPDIIKGLKRTNLCEPGEVAVERVMEDEELFQYDTMVRRQEDVTDTDAMSGEMKRSMEISDLTHATDYQSIPPFGEDSKLADNQSNISERGSSVESASSMLAQKSTDNEVDPLKNMFTSPSITENVSNGNSHDSSHTDYADSFSPWNEPLGLPSPTMPESNKPSGQTADKTKPRTKSAELKSTDQSKQTSKATDSKSSEKSRGPSASVVTKTKSTPPRVNGGVSNNATKVAPTSSGSPRSALSPRTSVTPKSLPKTSEPKKTATTTSVNKPDTVDHGKLPVFCVDVAYIPTDHDGNVSSARVSEVFFARIRARHYVLGGAEHDVAVLDSLVCARRGRVISADERDHEVTVVATTESPALRHWTESHAQELALLRVTVVWPPPSPLEPHHIDF